MGVWLSIPTSLFYNPTSVTIEGYNVTVYRDFPASEYGFLPIVRYSELVRPLDGTANVCTDTNAFQYRDNGEPSGTWSVEPWAAQCMVGSYEWSASWSVMIFGIIPLRPVHLGPLVVIER